MLEFMDFVQQSFYNSSRWSYENNYTNLTATSRALLDFDTPRGFHVDISSLSSPNFATSYALRSVGLVNGSLSYLYTSLPLTSAFQQAGRLNLHDVIRGYRQIQELPSPSSIRPPPSSDPSSTDTVKPPTLLYGRLYLPQSTLEALYVRRLSPTCQIKISAVSSSRLRNGGTLLALHQHDVGKYSTEALYSTDGGLLGFKGLYNFGADPRVRATPSTSSTSPNGAVAPSATPPTEDRIHGRFSAGAEAYYGTLNKSGGVSLGGRFATLPTYHGIPLTATLTLNPLMGNFSATYAVKAGEDVALCSRFEFNAYSYESELVLGCELWRRSVKLPVRLSGRSMAAKLAWRSEEEMFPPVPAPVPAPAPTDGLPMGVRLNGKDERGEVTGVFKGRVDEKLRVGVVWEGRVKDLLVCVGSTLDLRRRDQPFRSLGVELQYSS
ncbi:protein of unknown function DUF3722 [Pseudogymnoascus destructans]|uniref:Mitochondrial distribution and morphology protein 10 n=2 Tax=Pseudogymnoascus destructans TaxID=655981 RepID=L8FYY6_PSED2|nr:protein of unknown function DUF3722 [Pseudogymnoascus destructans]ELR05683.1 hypothetical protein GMDG_07526 [Pseudogymnoascus destructans 20631-21]OAF57682.1 protein of unknown function DUF3722 [Pseudogymnoascus destructans]